MTERGGDDSGEGSPREVEAYEVDAGAGLLLTAMMNATSMVKPFNKSIVDCDTVYSGKKAIERIQGTLHKTLGLTC
jgi:hypothetical protein